MLNIIDPMRYPKDQKEKTRRFVVETASRLLRRDGIEGVKIVPLMKEAGMTQGAFYKNFESRDELVVEAILHAAVQTRSLAMQWAAAGRDGAGGAVANIIDEYLSERHLDPREGGCPLAALGSELWRQPDAIRRAVFRAFKETVEVISLELPADRREMAWSLYMFLASVLQSARIAVTRKEQLSIMAEGRRTARMLFGAAT